MPNLRPFVLGAHQVAALEFHRGLRYSANLSALGTGKSAPTAARLNDLIPPRRGLVVSTAAMVGTRQHPGPWYYTLKRTNPHWTIEFLTGRKEERFKAINRPHHIGLINYEGLLVLGSDLIDVGRYGVLVLDEAHRLKSPSSMTSRASAALAKYADYIIGLTGSPILESPIDLYGVYRSIHPDMFGDDFVAWRDRFFEYKSEVDADGHHAYPKWLPKPGALEILASAVKAISFRVTHDQLPWDFPAEVSVEPVMVELKGKAREAYNRLKEDCEVGLATGTITVDNIRPKLLKMMQISSGWVYDDHHRAIPLGQSAKGEALYEVVQQIKPHPFVVWAVTPPDMTIIGRTLDRFRGQIRHGTIYGATPQAERASIMRDFNSGKLNALIAHPQCVGEGIDLEAAYDIRFSRTWSANQYAQSRGRCRRANSTRTRVFYIDLVTADTIDETVYHAIHHKMSFMSLLIKYANFAAVDEAARAEEAPEAPPGPQDEVGVTEPASEIPPGATATESNSAPQADPPQSPEGDDEQSAQAS